MIWLKAKKGYPYVYYVAIRTDDGTYIRKNLPAASPENAATQAGVSLLEQRGEATLNGQVYHLDSQMGKQLFLTELLKTDYIAERIG